MNAEDEDERARDALARRHPQGSADRTGSEAEQQREDDGEPEDEQEDRHDVAPSLRGTRAGHECDVAGISGRTHGDANEMTPAPNARAGPHQACTVR
jgi:hypothetical protein